MKQLLTFLFVISIASANSQLMFSEIHFVYGNELGAISEIVSGDLNGDGFNDFVVSSHGADKLSVGLNIGLAKPTFTAFSSNVDVRKITLYDFDNDGDLDVVGNAAFANVSLWWVNDGNGSFTKDTLPIPEYESIYFADINGDSEDELIVGIDKSLLVYTLANGTVNLLATVSDDPLLGAPSVIQVGDYNKDGTIDISGAFPLKGVYVFQQNSAGNFSRTLIEPPSFNVEGLFASDINNDMIVDFLSFSAFSTRTSIVKSNLVGAYEILNLPETNGNNVYSAFGDADLDGDVDILYVEEQNALTGTFSLQLNEGGVFTQQVLSSSFGGFSSGGFSDLNNDGQQDIYLYTNDLGNSGLVLYINSSPVDNDNDGFAVDVDCDDNDPDINPGVLETPYNGIDDDCDENTLDDDLDQDGFLLAEDCDDNNPAINPVAMETPYNGIDDDCDENTLDDDLDQDGFLLAEDCDDQNNAINPTAVEIPNNGIDEDCDGMDLMNAILEIANVQIEIFPNPVKDYLVIKSNAHTEFKLDLYDVFGKRYFPAMGGDRVYLHDLASGHYLLMIVETQTQEKVVYPFIIAP